MTPRRLHRPTVTAAFVALLLLALAAPALAASSSGHEPQVVLTGKVVVVQGETVGDVVIFNGPVTIDGTVDGTLTVFDGDVTISGTVTGDVTSFNGTVTLADGARVGGNLVTQSDPNVARGATVEGTRERIDTQVALGRVRWISRFAVWLAVTVSTLVFGVLLLWFAPRAGEATAAVALEKVGVSIGWGAALFFGLPILSVIALVTIVGIPFGIGTLLALALIYTLGYTASSFALGRALLKRPASRFLAFVAGWAILRAATLVPLVSGIVWFASTLYGLGALAVAARGGQRQPALATPIPPPPPPRTA